MAQRKQTPMMEQFHREKAQHPDKILFFRMGDFYEMFFDDAKLAARELGLTLTSRDKGENPIPMAGVPHHQCDRYLRELIQKGYKVAICDQLEDPSQAKGIVKRGVTRVVTPGTVVEDNCLTSHANNFLAAAQIMKHGAGLAWLDLSTGEFFAAQLPGAILADELERLAPAETLIPAGALDDGGPLASVLGFRAIGTTSPREAYHFDPDQGAMLLCAQFETQTLDGFGLDNESSAAIGAAGAILQYVQETQKASLAHIRSIRRIERGDFLVLDRTTQRNLELTHPLLAGGKSQTLLGVLDHTSTGPGGRLLKQWLLQPLAAVTPIRARQDAITELMTDAMLRAELREHLSGFADLERIMARVITGRASGRDIAALRDSLSRLPGLAELGKTLRAPLLAEHAGDLDCLDDLHGWICETLAEDPPVGLKEGCLIRDGVHDELDELRAIATGGKDWLARFQIEQAEATGISSLKVKFNKVFGYYIEVTKAHAEKVPAHYERKQTLVNAERYSIPELKEYEQKVLGAEERIVNLEYELFCQLRDRIGGEIERVQAVARSLAALDVLAALAEGGALRRYTIPEIHDGIETTIIGGRHPVLETMLSEGEFVENDTLFSEECGRILIITGPNMAGKSTYIRQTALIVILAHMGAPVPAASASVGLTDRVFTRVGAADDLSRGQSTFMVEMAETANILNNATERSLIVLDEVGRGTSTFDGVSLAWAITEFLHNTVKARTLFATHYHELAELGVILDQAQNLNVAVRDWGGEVIFLRKIQPGSCDRSYGIQVARLAGIPQGVIERSQEILHGLENQAAERDWDYTNEQQVLRAAAREVQLDLFAPKREQLESIGKTLQGVDPNALSPMQAHEFLTQLVQQANG